MADVKDTQITVRLDPATQNELDDLIVHYANTGFGDDVTASMVVRKAIRYLHEHVRQET